ncbi:MAG: cytochrome b [Xanthobacteraceae bacterium]
MVRNTDLVWGWPAKGLHWIAALFILLLLAHGWWMTHMAPRPERLAHYAGHSAMGFDLLALIGAAPAVALAQSRARAAGRLEDVGALERSCGSLRDVRAHVVSLTGWVTANTFRTPITRDLFGIPFPLIASGVDRSVRNLFEQSHMVLAYVLGALAVVHVLGALRHQLFKGNDVLRRMTWGCAPHKLQRDQPGQIPGLNRFTPI